jgi:Cu/Ag efflux protein CusF
MKKLIAAAAVLLALASSALAGEAGTTGKINSIDAANRTINFTHGPIEALGWPGMTMDFAVLPSIDLGALKVGETVAFTVSETPEGTYAVDSVTPTK